MDTSIIVAIISSAGVIIAAYIGKEKTGKKPKKKEGFGNKVLPTEETKNVDEKKTRSWFSKSINRKIEDKNKKEISNENDNTSIKIRRSKNHGKKDPWVIRTFYSLNKSDLKKFDNIQFEIKETDIKIIIATDEIEREVFDYDIHDGFSIYINQDENKKFFINRLGNSISGIIYELVSISDKPANFTIKKIKG